LPDAFVIQGPHDPIAEGRHGDVDVLDVPPDIAHRNLAHVRRPERPPEGLFDREQNFPDGVRARPKSFKGEFHAAARSRQRRAGLERQTIQLR